MSAHVPETALVDSQKNPRSVSRTTACRAPAAMKALSQATLVELARAGAVHDHTLHGCADC